MQINVYQEGTKVNTEVNETFEEYWYALEYKARLISTSTNFLHLAVETRKLLILTYNLHNSCSQTHFKVYIRLYQY